MPDCLARWITDTTVHAAEQHLIGQSCGYLVRRNRNPLRLGLNRTGGLYTRLVAVQRMIKCGLFRKNTFSSMTLHVAKHTYTAKTPPIRLGTSGGTVERPWQGHTRNNMNQRTVHFDNIHQHFIERTVTDSTVSFSPLPLPFDRQGGRSWNYWMEAETSESIHTPTHTRTHQIDLILLTTKTNLNDQIASSCVDWLRAMYDLTCTVGLPLVAIHSTAIL